jgi:hypothetical protein
MRRKFTLLMLFLFVSMNGLASELWQKVSSIKASDSIETVKKVFGDYKRINNFYVIEAPDYEIRRNDQENIFALTLKKELKLQELSVQQFEMIAPLMSGPDIILGSIVGIPDSGLILEVMKSGLIRKISWVTPWRPKKVLSKNEVISLLGEGGISK